MKKIPTLFKRNQNNMREILPDVTPGCEWVLNGEGVATRKYDGTCCKIDENGFWKRREVKKGKPEPKMFVLEEEDKITGKKVGWVPVLLDDKTDQYYWEACPPTAPKSVIKYGTYELIGPKVQGNPENRVRHELLKHSEAEVFPDVPRTFSGIADFLFIHNIEGIVFHHPDGRMAKIKKRDYGMKRTTGNGSPLAGDGK